MKLCALFVATVLTANAGAGTLNEWLIHQITADEQRLLKAVTRTDGYSLELLRDSTYYVPFFLEPPSNFTFASPEQQSSFEEFASKQVSDFLPGGYVYRLTFHYAPALYATSAGYWEEGSWRSLALEKDLRVDPDQLWEAREGENYLYTTLLAGSPPRLLVYGRSGQVVRDEAFDPSAVDFEQRVQHALQSYAENGKPDLEMISLNEYVANPAAPWRPVDMSGPFNLRNQHQRKDEQARLKDISPRTRESMIQALQSGVQTSIQQRPEETPDQVDPARAPGESNVPDNSASSHEQSASSRAPHPRAPWPWLLAIALLLIIGALALTRRR